ncbi:VOC family protein [Asticcacaulis excentricus]|nr:VOC family protein [Asticcacaulis excentricus]
MSHIAGVTLVVPDYDEAITHYCTGLGFDLIEDTDLGGGKRWVLIAPKGSSETRLLLGKASNEGQRAAIGNQAGGRVFLILFTDDFARDHERFGAAGAVFTETPRHETYGTVAVFRDKFGNLWDLLEPK